DGAGSLLVAHPGGSALPVALGDLGAVDRVTLMVGPEGGWSDDELACLISARGRLVGLGPTILRTEHAAAAGLAVLAAMLGRWSGHPSAHT
ncbi:MAG: RsmE family RNA methyltransferase, partial [Intrasporangiaceae bacterium]|nr:RsmE family RNA methyltransferase [Intrasporangiaceae bacterium]